MVKVGPESCQNKEGFFQPIVQITNEGNKKKESANFLSKK